MGTRGAMGVRINGHDHVTYNHYDSYPEGLGADIVDVLQHNPINKLKNLANYLIPVKEDQEPTVYEIEALRNYLDLTVGQQKETDWYCLLRGTQGDFLKFLNAQYYIDSYDFLKDSLFCEFAYIVNFDDNVFEVYQGFQKTRHTYGRYANLSRETYAKEVDDYYPVALVATFPLDNIPEDWIKIAFPQEED